MSVKGQRTNILGQRFGRLIVKEIACETYRPNGNFHQYKYLCHCDCGNTRIVASLSLKSGATKSCGCIRKEMVIKRNKELARGENALAAKYHHMRDRCTNPKHDHYQNYGGRGITICDEWLGENGLRNFCEWALKNGYQEGLSLERIDVNGNYEPSNCKWIPLREQWFNKRNTRYINGVPIAKTAYESGVKRSTVMSRIKRGWDEKDLFLPPGMKRQAGSRQ